jgi:alpha-ribazole phosphatase
VTHTRVLLIRHAEPEEEMRGRCYGRLDIGLSAAGLERAAALAERLLTVELAAVHTSPRLRAAQTAAAICAGRALDPVSAEELRELDFGDLEGRTYDEIEREQPAFFRSWMEAPTEIRFPAGESYSELRQRVSAALDALRTTHAGHTVAVVSHGGVVRAALATVLAIPDERAFALDVGYARVSIVDWFDGTPVVRLVNATAADASVDLGL